MSILNRKKKSDSIDSLTDSKVLKDLGDAIRLSTESMNRNAEQTTRACNELNKALNRVAKEMSRTR